MGAGSSIRYLQTLPQSFNVSIKSLARLSLKAVDTLRCDYWQHFHLIIFNEVRSFSLETLRIID